MFAYTSSRILRILKISTDYGEKTLRFYALKKTQIFPRLFLQRYAWRTGIFITFLLFAHFPTLLLLPSLALLWCAPVFGKVTRSTSPVWRRNTWKGMQRKSTTVKNRKRATLVVHGGHMLGKRFLRKDNAKQFSNILIKSFTEVFRFRSHFYYTNRFCVFIGCFILPLEIYNIYMYNIYLCH